jgi:hypothetical protein
MISMRNLKKKISKMRKKIKKRIIQKNQKTTRLMRLIKEKRG